MVPQTLQEISVLHKEGEEWGLSKIVFNSAYVSIHYLLFNIHKAHLHQSDGKRVL